MLQQHEWTRHTERVHIAPIQEWIFFFSFCLMCFAYFFFFFFHFVAFVVIFQYFSSFFLLSWTYKRIGFREGVNVCVILLFIDLPSMWEKQCADAHIHLFATCCVYYEWTSVKWQRRWFQVKNISKKKRIERKKYNKFVWNIHIHTFSSIVFVSHAQILHQVMSILFDHFAFKHAQLTCRWAGVRINVYQGELASYAI